MLLILFDSMYTLEFSQKQNSNLLGDKLSPVSNMASSRSEENVYLKLFQHHYVSQCWSVLQFLWTLLVLDILTDVVVSC